MNLLIIFLCFVTLFIYKRTQSYVSINGILMLFILAVLIFIKFKITGDFAPLGFRLDNFRATLFPTTIFVFLGIPFLYSIRIKTQRFKAVKWLISLAGLYLIFGIVQQTFFQSIFTHSLNILLGNKALSVVLSGIFFAAFHWKAGIKGIKFGVMALVGGVVLSYLFLSSPNIILLGISHALLASAYYFWINDENNLERRLVLQHA